TQEGRTRIFTLPAELVERLRALGQEEGATLFMTLLSGFAALLGRYAGQEEVVVGTAVANRSRSDLEGLVGCFVNTLALRMDLRGGPSVRELLGRVRAMTLAAYAHQELPFERLVERLQPERDVTRHPVFQVMLVLQNAASA